MESDLINRQAAIDALDGEIIVTGRENAEAVRGYANLVLDRIKRLPSAQSAITCDGCRFVGTYDTNFPCRNCVRREKDYYEPER